MSVLDRYLALGRYGVESIRSLGRATLLLWNSITWGGPGSAGFSELITQIHSVGVRSLSIILVAGFFVGMVLGLQGLISRPMLALLFSIVGIWGGAFGAVDMLGIDEGAYWGNMQASVDFYEDVIKGVIKSGAFVLVVTWIAVFQGYDSVPTSEGIGKATTQTVVVSSLAVLGLDFVLTAVMLGGI